MSLASVFRQFIWFTIPLAWLELFRERARLLVALAGVTFAVVLIFMQLGFRTALFESAVRFHKRLDGDVVLISPQFSYLVLPRSFSRRRLQQARSFPGVAGVSPVYLGLGLWKNPRTGRTRNIFVAGIDTSNSAFDLADVNRQLRTIQQPDQVLFDAASRPEYGPIATEFRAGQRVTTEVANRRVTVAGLFELGTSFGVDGSLFASDSTFLRIFPFRRQGLIDIGVVQLQPGARPEAVRAALRAGLPEDVLPLTKSEFVEREQRYWGASTPIGYVFTFGVIIGFVVGAVIVYQILFADVSQHLAEYATLKAMGYASWTLFSIVLEQAVILASLGYAVGLVICLWLYGLAADSTRLPMQMTGGVALFVLALTVSMCCVSGGLALRKVRAADPAEIF